MITCHWNLLSADARRLVFQLASRDATSIRHQLGCAQQNHSQRRRNSHHWGRRDHSDRGCTREGTSLSSCRTNETIRYDPYRLEGAVVVAAHESLVGTK